MKKLPFILLLMLGLVSCEEENHCVASIQDDCACYHYYDPVCGCNDVTYGNECEAECRGITDYTPGACP